MQKIEHNSLCETESYKGMTDNDIKKALECCSLGDHIGVCTECPFTDICDEDEQALQKNALDLINRQKAEIERLQKKREAKCGTCAYAKPATFGKSKCYVECTNQEHIEKFCRYRKISLKRQRTTPACKSYKEMTE